MKISRQRESNIRLKRPIALELIRAADGADTNKIRVIASTDENYDWGYYNEQLLHGVDNVERSGAVSCLFNHDCNQVIGRILSTECDGHRMTAECEIDPEVTGSNGLKLLRAIKQGYLRGVSIGYDYRREDCTFTEDENGKRSVVVRKWQLREISITPTPADLAAQVMGARTAWAKEAFAAREVLPMEFKNWLAKRGLKHDELKEGELALLKRAFDAEQAEAAAVRAAAAAVVPTPAPVVNDELALERAARKAAELELEMVEHARSYGIEVKPGEFKGKSKADCLAMLLERKAKAQESRPAESVAVNITADGLDKQRDAATDALLHRAGVPMAEEKLQGNPFVSRRAIEIGRRLGQAVGMRGIADWTDNEVGHWMLERANRRLMRSANVTTDMFASFVLLNVMDKAVALGFKAFGQAGQATYKKWTRTRNVMDFKTVTGAALDVGNLVKTVEDAPFPELNKAEFGYSAALAMWGVTASLTLQTLINDDLGEFINQIFRSGQIAGRTIEKEVYAQLEALTWTNNVSTGAGLGTGAAPTPGNFDVARQAFMNKVGPAGEKLGNIPRFLIHQPTQGVPVGIALGRIINYGGISGSVPAVTSIEPVETPYLAGTATTYYVVGDPNLVDTLILLMLTGMDVPQIEEFDAGAVAARKWKIYMPFTAKPASNTINGTIITPGMQQATV